MPTDRKPLRDRLLDYAGGILLVVAAAYMAITIWAILTVKQSQDQHHQDLVTIEQYAKSIDQAGANIEIALATNHGATYNVLVNLCHVTPGCVVPPSDTTSTTGGHK